jgi:sugar phosphate isomerase/epimerase
VYVACSTLCFGRATLDNALLSIAELEFSKFEVAIEERGCQLRPSEVVADIGAAASRLRMGPGLTPTAFLVTLDSTSEDEAVRQFKSICRLARMTTVPVITLSAAPNDSAFAAEVQRLTRLNTLAIADGVQLNVATEVGTLTEDPDRAVQLCEKVPGLGLTLDPSHYIVGPHAGKSYDQVFPYVRHVQLRDTGKGPNQFQVRVGQGEIEYGRIIAQLDRHRYDRALSVDIRDTEAMPYGMGSEVRKLKYLLESLV